MNKAILIGHVGHDPEIRRTQDGRLIANFSLATSERWKDKNTGERKERTQWHRIVVFNEAICKVVEQYVKKGAKLAIEGMIETRKWTDQAGVEKYTTEIVLKAFGASLEMLDRAGAGVPPAQSESDYGSERTRDQASGDFGSSARKPAMAGGGSSGMDDEIPF